MTPRLLLQSVETRLGARDFHYDFSLDGPAMVAVSGPSGSGKTTLFNLIAGFEPPRRGQVLMDGRDVTNLPPGKRPLTMIFQDHNLFAHLDVFTNVALGVSPALRLDAAERAGVSKALAEVGLAGFDGRMPQALSGGERQRVAFARALVRRRPFLLLDEPFASLDPALRTDMGDMLRAMQRRMGMLVLMISHDHAEVSRLADRVLEISDGRNRFSGKNAISPLPD
jgi:thiamine transport system ATP-binding protein